jgi:hypothetical protein
MIRQSIGGEKRVSKSPMPYEPSNWRTSGQQLVHPSPLSLFACPELAAQDPARTAEGPDCRLHNRRYPGSVLGFIRALAQKHHPRGP